MAKDRSVKAHLIRGETRKLFTLLAALAAGMMACSVFPRSGPPPFDLSQAECTPRQDDPDGYLLAICEYLVENYDTYEIDPAELHIVSVKTGTEQGEEVIIVSLDCCYTGDSAILDPETGEVLKFRFGGL